MTNRTSDNTDKSTLKLPMPCVTRPPAAPVKTQNRLKYQIIRNTLDIKQYNDSK